MWPVDPAPSEFFPISVVFDGLFALVAGTGSAMSITEPGGATYAPARFYRVRLM